MNTKSSSKIKQRLVTLFSALIIISLYGCASSSPDMAAPEEVPSYSEKPYEIGVGDSLRIDVWGNEKLSIQVPVRPDGKISMSLIGDILAADNTAESLAENITTALLNYIKNPQVTVIVANPSSSDFQARVRVTGAVRSPQSVAFRKGMSVLDLVLMAGGVNEFARPANAKLYRRVAGKVKVYKVNLDDILRFGKLDTNYMLMPSDIITVPERSF